MKKTTTYKSAVKALGLELLIMKEAGDRTILVKIMAPTLATIYNIGVNQAISDLSRSYIDLVAKEDPVGEAAWKTSISLGVKYVDSDSKF